MKRNTSLLSCLTLLTLAVASGCDKPRALGQMNNLVVAASDRVWEAVEEDVEDALEPRAFTVRDERIFDVASVDPETEEWERLRLVRQVLLVGEATDPWMEEALRRHRGEVPAPPAVLQVQNVWAQNQRVTIVLLPQDADLSQATPLLHEAGAILLNQYEQWARARMFASRADEELADSLLENAGFSLLLPQVYYYDQFPSGLFVFRNDYPDPSQLIRSIQVDVRDAADVEFTPEAARAWRAEITSQYTDPVQETEAEIVQARELEVAGQPAIEIQGIWNNPPGGWPAAGPYITRLVRCGERVFLVDAWLYAPGSPKFEYMVQLTTILDSFACGS